jgi:hypothetical protein
MPFLGRLGTQSTRGFGFTIISGVAGTTVYNQAGTYTWTAPAGSGGDGGGGGGGNPSKIVPAAAGGGGVDIYGQGSNGAAGTDSTNTSYPTATNFGTGGGGGSGGSAGLVSTTRLGNSVYGYYYPGGPGGCYGGGGGGASYYSLYCMLPNEKLAASTDQDGWTSPETTQMSLNYNQTIPYHHVVIKNLLDRIVKLETKLSEITSKNII